MVRIFGNHLNVFDMELYRVNLNNFGEEDDDYYVVANSRSEAVEIIELALQRESHYADRAHEMNKCYVDGFQQEKEVLIANNVSGYYRIETNPVDYSMNAIMPFIPFSIRRYYIDLALNVLE